MKIEIDITTDAIIEQVATCILAMHAPEYDDEGEPIENRHSRNSLTEIIEKTVIKRVQRAVDEQVTKVTEEHVKAAVAAVLAEGWQKTDNYGSPSGPKMDIKARVGETLTKLQGDSYSSNRKNLVDAIIEQAVAATLKTEFDKVIADARDKFKSMIDGVVTAKLNETLKSALGLR